MQISINICNILYNSVDCFGLIDENCGLLYNIHRHFTTEGEHSALETKISRYLHTEAVKPEHRLTRNSSALYLLLILCVFGCMALSSWLSAIIRVARLTVQIILYLVVIGGGYLVYRRFLVGYQYTVTSEELIVDQLIGGRQKKLLSVPLQNIIRCGKPEQLKNTKTENAYLGKKADSLMVLYERDQRLHALYVSGSETLRTILTEQTDGERATVNAD